MWSEKKKKNLNGGGKKKTNPAVLARVHSLLTSGKGEKWKPGTALKGEMCKVTLLLLLSLHSQDRVTQPRRPARESGNVIFIPGGHLSS